jgi:hypothetical protein
MTTENEPTTVDAPQAEAPTTEAHTDDHAESRPRGTALIVGVFLIVTAGVWAWAYYLLQTWGG